MAVFTRQSGSWQPLKGMFINNGISFVNAKQGWVRDGGVWRIFYPEVPINTGLPTISGTAATGLAISVSDGSWNTNGAYAPTSYSYQWLRDGVEISGATGSSRTCDSNDIGKNLSCRVTATNGRGSTPATSSTVFVVPRMTIAPTLTDSTATPSDVTSFTGTASTTTLRAWSASWINPTLNRTGTSVSVTNGTINTFNESNVSAVNGVATQNSVTVTVTPYNTNYQVTASWSPVIGATSYDVRLDSGTLQNQTATSVTYTTDSSAHTVSVFPKVGTVTGIGATSNSISPTRKNSNGQSVTITLPNPTVTASSTNGYNTFSVTMTLGADTKSVVFEWGTTTSYGSVVGTYTTDGTRSPIGPLTAGLRYWKVTPYSGLSATGLAGAPVTGTATVWTPPTIGTPAWTAANNFIRNNTAQTLRWFTDYPSVSGDYSSITGMDFEIRTTAGGGTLLASGTRAYPGLFSYPYTVSGVGWQFRMGTADSDIVWDSAARFGRVRVRVLRNDGTAAVGSWTGWI